MERLRSELELATSQKLKVEKLLLLKDYELRETKVRYSTEINSLESKLQSFKQFCINPDELTERVKSLEEKLEQSRAQVKGLSLELARERDRNRVGASILQGLAESLVNNSPMETGVYRWSMKEELAGKWKLNVEAESGQPQSMVGLSSPTPRPPSVHSGLTDNLNRIKAETKPSELPAGEAENISSPASSIIDVERLSEGSMEMNGLSGRTCNKDPPAAAPPGPTRVSDNLRSISLDSHFGDFRESTPMRFTITTPLVDKWIASLPKPGNGNGKQLAKARKSGPASKKQTPPVLATHGVFDQTQHICECGKRFGSNQAFKRHLKYYSRKLHKSVFGCEPNPPTFDIICDICGKTSPNKGLLKVHMNREHRSR